MTIYELTEEYLQLLAASEDADYDPEIIESMMSDIGEDIENKAESYLIVDKELESKENALDAEIKRLTARKKTISSNRTKIKDTLKNVMEVTGKTKFKTNLFSLYIKNNPPSVKLDVPVEELPIEYLTFDVPKPNKDMIKKALLADEDIKFAHLEQGQSLIIK